MFVCVVCNTDTDFCPAESFGEDPEGLLIALEACDGFWAAGCAQSKARAANLCVDAAYYKANGRENVGDCLYEPTGFMVEFNSVTGTMEGYKAFDVRVDRRHSNPLRLRWSVEEDAAEPVW
jgi:hypothetical protein